MEHITLKFSINEINTMLTALGNLPYVQVMELISKIQEQAKEQLASAGNQVASQEN